MLGILDNLSDDAGKNIAVGIGTFIMTAVIIGVPILAALSFVFNWNALIKIVTCIVSCVIFVVLWSVFVDWCSDE